MGIESTFAHNRQNNKEIAARGERRFQPPRLTRTRYTPSLARLAEKPLEGGFWWNFCNVPALARKGLAAGWLRGDRLIDGVRDGNRDGGLRRILLALAGKVVAGGEVLVELAGQLRRTGAKCRPAAFEKENRN